jgi:hypothetical protein
MKKLHFTIFVGLAILLDSCSHRLVDYTIISTKNVDLSKMSTYTRYRNRVEGKDVTHIILCFPMGTPNMKEAIDRAIEHVPGAVALVDGVVYSKGWNAIVYGQSSYVVEGTPLIDPAIAENELPEYIYLELDKKGRIKKQTNFSEKEYLALKTGLIKTHTKKQELDSLN